MRNVIELCFVGEFSTAIVGSRRPAWRCACQRKQVLCSTSKSAKSTLRPAQASATAVERASVDFPTTPFWEAKRMWRAMAAAVLAEGGAHAAIAQLSAFLMTNVNH